MNNLSNKFNGPLSNFFRMKQGLHNHVYKTCLEALGSTSHCFLKSFRISSVFKGRKQKPVLLSFGYSLTHSLFSLVLIPVKKQLILRFYIEIWCFSSGRTCDTIRGSNVKRMISYSHLFNPQTTPVITTSVSMLVSAWFTSHLFNDCRFI